MVLNKSTFGNVSIIALTVFIIFSCSKKDSTSVPLPSTPRTIDSNIVKLAPGTIWIDSITGANMQSIHDSMVTFVGNTLQLSQMKKGTIIVSGILDKAPVGFFGRIIDIQHSGQNWTVTLTQAALTEAFETLNVSYRNQLARVNNKRKCLSGIN